MPEALQFPIIDLSFPDRFPIANLIRQGCVDHGFFYLVNHGVDEELISKVFEQSSNFFSLPIEEKMKLVRKNHRGYTALYAEKLDTTLTTEGDSKESFYIGPLADDLNQWPLEGIRSAIVKKHNGDLSPKAAVSPWSAVTKLLSLIALSLKLEEDFFEKVGALIEPLAFIRLLHYPGDFNSTSEEIFGASAHSDYGMVTLLVTDGVPGLQICREKSKQPQVWEDVPSMSGAFIVNIGDMMERWTNGLFRLHSLQILAKTVLWNVWKAVAPSLVHQGTDSTGDPKESFYIGPLTDDLNQWPLEVEVMHHSKLIISAKEIAINTFAATEKCRTLQRYCNACIDHGFFYLVNHGVDEELVNEVFEQSSKFFSLPIEEKMKVIIKNYSGYSPLYAGKLDTTLSTKGDSNEGFYVGQLAGDLNQWPLEGMSAGTKLLSLIALSLKLDEDFFEKVGAFNEPLASLGLLHYPGDLDSSNEEIYGASAHSDFGMLTLLATDGVPGLQICREKSEQPQVWEDVPSMSGAFIVNIGDMMERWTNCLFRSRLHRVLPPRQERYSVTIYPFSSLSIIMPLLFRKVAFFLNPSKDCNVECLESCCSEDCPPRFPPIKALDYLEERLKLTYGL
ncbi:hypothetical protein Godav_012119 [Gossypium davidsonii]|uniref:Fe2OG dioxygenase domain-containing protein n=1 Tax=Gossypium davidsonii TaxID=34287 RepID=A0A7J8RCC1_GOSDV|nr:hypothetical protein [Gossypium davidsonii]